MAERIVSFAQRAMHRFPFHPPVSIRLFFTSTTRASKEKAAFLVCVLLPLGIGFSNVLMLGCVALLVLVVVPIFDLQLAYMVGTSKETLAEALRDSGRAEEALKLRGIDEFARIQCLRVIAKDKLGNGDKAGALQSLNEANDLIVKSTVIPKQSDIKVEQKLVKKVMDVADTLNDLGSLLQDTPNVDSAKIEAVFEEALRLGRISAGREDPQVTVWIMNLGIYKQQQLGKLDESFKLYNEVLEIRKSVLGEDDPLVAQWMVSMAYLLLSRPDAVDIGADIDKLVQGALAIRRRIYGNDHVEVAASLNDCALIAALTAKDGDDSGLVKARDYGQESARTYERVLGKDHPTAVKARADWGL